MSQLFTSGDQRIGSQREKRVAEDEMVRECHGLNGHESEKTLGDRKGQASLAGYSQWGHQESDTT